MRRTNIASATIVIAIILGLFAFSMPVEVKSQTTICPNSGIKCNVTFEHPEYGEVTVESEKGEDDSAVELSEEA